MPHPLIDQRLHLLDIRESVRSSGNFAVMRMDPMVLHIEQALRFTKRARDVVFALVGVAGVDFGQFGGVGDEEHGGCYAEYGA